ncbi:MAG TPA: DUF5678 domain-containing protein [Blastocatellia bacterium]|nr:DUF5678 domain-containing protein [Blastocatellia bacterium]
MAESKTLEPQDQIDARVEPEDASGDLPADMATSPEANGIIVNQDGVFIPRSILGENTEIHYQVGRGAEGGVLVTIASHPRDRQKKPRRVAEPLDCSRELRWLAKHRDEFIGQWVALDGDRLLSHGTDAREVYNQARALGVEAPVLVEVRPADELPFGGW